MIKVLISHSCYHEESRTINNTPSVIGGASDCDASRKTKDARSKNHGSHSSEGWPKKARVRHLPKDFKGVFLPPMCEGESVAGHGKGTGLELKVFNVPREFQGGQQARASSKGRDYRLESRR